MDHWRATTHVEHGVTFDEVSRDSVEDIVEHRMQLDATFVAIRRLSRSDQEHLIRLLNEPTVAGPIPSRTKVAVHRARRRLLVALGQVGAVLAGLRLPAKSRKVPGATVLAVGALMPVAFLLATRSPGPLERGSPGITQPALDISVPASLHAQDPSTPLRPSPSGLGTSLARSSGSVALRTPSAPPETTVPIRYPAGLPPGEITVRPRRPDDHLVCVNKLPIVLQACVD